MHYKLSHNPTAKLIAAGLIVILALASLPVKPAMASSITLPPGTSWTVPAGVTSITIECWGAGGGGGSRNSSGGTGGGGGGGGGAYAKVNTYTVTPGASIPYVIGAGGTAGNAGGTTSFNSTVCVAAGGSGVALNTTTGGMGGLASASTGDVTFDGGIGYSYSTGTYGAGGGGSAGTASAGNNTVSTNATNNSGAVAVVGGGPGGDGGTSASPNGKTPGSGPGGGGGGAYRSSSSRTGGTGKAGQIIITYTAPPTVTLPTATTITDTTATLGATVSSPDVPVTDRGTYWATTATPRENPLSEGSGTGTFSHLRTGLPQATLIYYAGYATNSVTTSYSPDGSFYTEPTTQASGVGFTLPTGTSMTVSWTRGSAGDTLGGVIVLMKAGSAVNSDPVDGTYTTYTANAAFGNGAQIGTGNYVVYKGVGTSVPVTNLLPGITYYVAVYEFAGKVNSSGVNQGTNYKPGPATGNQATPTIAPSVTTNPATGVKRTGAILNGTVNANNSSTTVTFEYGLTNAYGTTVTAAESPVTGAVNTQVSFSIPGGLTPSTTYHFRVVGVSTAGSNTGGDRTFTTNAAGSTTYYVNNTVACSDLNPGTSTSAPFCTINHGGIVADAGDTVRVLAGTYAETVKASNNGGSGMPITFSAAPGVTVTGEAGNSTNGGAFRLFHKGYIVIDGFIITGTADYGFYISTSNNIQVLNNHVSYSGSSGVYRPGIYLTETTNSIVGGNTSDHNWGDGIRLNIGSDYNIIRDNISFGNAIRDASQATGINFLGSSHNVVLHNITYANEDSGLNLYDGSSFNQIIGNLSYGNGDHGIDNNASPYNVHIGNTVHGNVTVGINFELNSGGAIVQNNICMDNGYRRLVGGGTFSTSNPGNIRVDSSSTTNTALDYDLVYNSNAGTDQIIWGLGIYTSMAAFHSANPSQEANGLEANPLFTSPAPIAARPVSAPFNVAINLGDYHILAGSPAIDSANSDAPGETTLDLDGNARVDVPTVANTGAGTRAYDDRGVYEYQLKQNQTITVTSTAPAGAIFGGPTYTPTATATSGLPVTITVDPTASTVCSITAGVVSYIGVGNCILNFNQAGNLFYNPAPQVQQTFAVGQASQTISVTTSAPVSAGYNSSFTVAATASSSLPVTYSATGACSNLLGVFTITSPTGTCTVHYNQAGNANYSAAPEVTESVTATKGAQTITVISHAPASAEYLSSFIVSATATSGLPVIYSASGACTNVGNTFTMSSGFGTCTVHYNQPGDINFAAAPQITEDVLATGAVQIYLPIILY